MRTVVWDIETRSVANLRDCGAFVYARDPTTQPLCVAYAIDDAEPQLWLPSEPAPEIFAAIAAAPDDYLLVAHNWEFERAVLEHVLVPRHGFPHIPLRAQRCSMRLALANAYPAELDLLAQALGLPYRKDPEARRAMLAVSRPKQARKRKPGTIPLWDEDPGKLALLYARCRLDVITTRAVWSSQKLTPLIGQEQRYLLLDAVINGRGIRCDRPFATAARDLAIHERIAINLKLEELTDGAITTANQVQRLLAAINAHGHAMASLNKRAVAQVLAGKPDDFVRELLELRRDAARASVNKFKRMLAYAAADDDRMRGTLRMYGGAPGRWAGLGPQLQNLKKNESGLPLAVVDSVRSGAREEIARYGNPLALLGDISRASLCAAPGMELKSGDFSAVESVVLAWLAGEQWKLDAYREFQRSGDLTREPYRVIARKMLQRPDDAEINSAERQMGKAAELASGFGGGIGAWRRISHHDERSDDEIRLVMHQWRDAHPAITRFWRELARAIRVAMRTGQPVVVASPPRPRLIADFRDGTLTLTLPSGRAISYPEARLVPGRFEDGDPEVEFKDNARRQWKPMRGWFGVFIENCVQGVARDLLAAAIERCELYGYPVVFHCHDEVTIEVPAGSLSDTAFLLVLLELPDWANGLPLSGKVHSGAHYLPEPKPDEIAKPLPAEVLLDEAVDSLLAESRADIGEIDDPALVEREDDEAFVGSLGESVAPLTELVSLPLTADNKVACPFHDEIEPSCAIYPDHYHCFGCGAHGDRLEWLIEAEGLTKAEAISLIKDWPPAPIVPAQNGDAQNAKLALVESLWAEALPLAGSLAARYLDETRHIDLAKLPASIHDSLRFHPRCVFGPGAHLPCLLALMRDPETDVIVGVQRTALVERNGRVEKLDRRMLGHAGVVKLWPAGTQLVVGEGLETVLAAATRIPYHGAPLTPAWAALSSKKLKTLPPIPSVERLILLVDNDKSQEGQQAAAEAARYWRASGRNVVPLTPKTPDTDFNDLVIAEDGHGVP